MLARYLLVPLLLVCCNLSILKAQQEANLIEKIQLVRNSAYKSLLEAKTDSAIIQTNQLLQISKDDSLSQFIKAKQYNFAAYIYEQLGNPATSYAYADSASEVLIKIDSINAELARGFWTKGTSLLRLGDYTRAKNNLENALTIATPINYYPADIQNDLADCFYLMGDISNSKKLYEGLLENPQQLSPLLNLIINANLTDIYLNEKNVAKAKKTWAPIDEIISQGHLDGSPKLAELLKIKAQLFSAQKNYSQALITIEEAIESQQKVNPNNLRVLLKLYCDKTELELQSKKLDRASKSIHQALKIITQNEDDFSNDPYNMVVHHLKAKVDKDSTIFHCRKAQQIADMIRFNMLHQRSKLALAEYLKSNTAIGLDASFNSYKNQNQESHFEDAFFFMDKSRSQILLDEMTEQVWSKQNAVDIIEEIEQLELKKAQLIETGKIDRISISLEKAKQQLREQFGTSYNGVMGEKDFQIIKEFTASNEVSLLMFGSGVEFSYALLIQEASIQFTKLEIDNDALTMMLAKHKALLDNPNTDPNSYMQSAYEIYQLIFKDLDIQHRNVQIITNTVLKDLSFASLVIDNKQNENYKSLSYFSDQYVLQYSLSCYFLHQEKDASGEIFAIVDKESEFGNLESHFEMLNKNLADLNSEILERTTLDELDKKITNSSLIHISSHGFFDNDDVSKSYIILPGKEDFTYGLTEIYQQSLNAKPLVVLNSCETGKGHELKGEGSNNFTRAFTYAGASGVIESAWKINVFSTAEIFKHFYTLLKTGDDSAEALSKSMKLFRQQENIDDSFSHPYYWSGFKHYGGASILKKRHKVPLSLMIIAGMLVLAFMGINWRKTKS